MAAQQAPPFLGFSRQEHWSGLPFPSLMHESEKWKWSRSVMSDPQRPHGLQRTRLLRPWDFPGKSTGVGCHCLLQINSKLNYFFLSREKFLKKKSITYLWPFLPSTQKHHLNLGNIIICTSKPSFTHLTNIANAFFKDKAQCWKTWVKQEVIPLLLWKVYNLAGWFKSEDFKIQEQEFPV